MPSVWSIKWDSRAVKDLAEIPKTDQKRIIDVIEMLALDPIRGKALKGRWKSLRRIRVGVYRVIYSIRGAELIIVVLRVGSRAGIYR